MVERLGFGAHEGGPQVFHGNIFHGKSELRAKPRVAMVRCALLGWIAFVGVSLVSAGTAEATLMKLELIVLSTDPMPGDFRKLQFPQRTGIP